MHLSVTALLLMSLPCLTPSAKAAEPDCEAISRALSCSHFQPVTQEMLERARERLVAVLAEFLRVEAINGFDRGELDDLRKNLEPVTSDAKVTDPLADGGAEHYRGSLLSVIQASDHPDSAIELLGLFDSFVQLRRHLESHCDLRREFIERRRALERLLSGYSTAATREKHDAIREHIRWFIRHEQATQAVCLAQRELCHPNLILQVNADRIRVPIEPQRCRVPPSFEGGFLTTGRGILDGYVRLAHDSADAGKPLLLEFRGRFGMQMLTRGKSICFVTHGKTALLLRMPLGLWPERGLIAGAPVGRGATRLCPGDVMLARRAMMPNLIRRLAARKISRKVPESELEASRKILRTVKDELNEKLDNTLCEVNLAYRRSLFFPQAVRIEGRGDLISVHVREDYLSGLGAPGPPPRGSDGSHVCARIHDSFVTSLANHLLATREGLRNGFVTINLSRLQRALPKKLPDGLVAFELLDEQDRVVELVFDVEWPMTVQFKEKRVLLMLNLKSIRNVGNHCVLPVTRLTLPYEYDDDSHTFTRRCPSYRVGRGTPNDKIPADLPKLLERHVTRHFSPEINVSRWIRRPFPAKAEGLRALKGVSVTALDFSEGWLSVGIDLGLEDGPTK